MHTSRTALMALALVATGVPARADVMGLGFKPIAVTVTFEKTGPGNLVAYPSDCHVSQLDFKLNPHLKFEQTYDAVEVGKPRASYKSCGEKTQLYVLDEAKFAKTKGPEEGDWRHSAWKIAALDKVAIPERDALFASGAGIKATGYSMPAFGVIVTQSPLKEVRERVTVADGKATRAVITYVYDDGKEETLDYPPGRRPQPGRPEARDWMPGLIGPGAPAPSASASAGPAASAPAAAASAPAAKGSCSGCSAPGEPASSAAVLALCLALGGLALRRR